MFLEPHGELRGDHVGEIAQAILFVLETVLQLELSMRGKAIARRYVRAPEIAAPGSASTLSVGDRAKKLLIPAQRAE